MLKRLSLAAVALTLALPLSALAADDASQARWFRYYNEKNQPTVTDVVTPEHVSRGYDELTASMQVIRHIPPQRAMTAEEQAAARAKREAEKAREKDDKQLLRLYSRPQDAELARNRKIDALQVRIDFSSGQIQRLRQSRAGEAQKATLFERKGRPVPADLKASIEQYDKQIQAAQAEIQARKAEQEQVRTEFAGVIQRLVELTGKPATPTAPAAGATAPAAPAKPAATAPATKP